MTINCIPSKELFFDPVNGYRILACVPNEEKHKIKLNKYGNFTISGTGLTTIHLNQPIVLEVEKKESSKYEGEYKCAGYGGIKVQETGNITIPQEQEEAILCQFMTKVQANNVLKAYPNFVEMVLNGKENEFDINKIYNVGKIRIVEYIDKIKTNCEMIFFNKDCWKVGITKDSDIDKIKSKFRKSNLFLESFHDSPYETLCKKLEFNFEKADPIVLFNFPNLEDSRERCKYFCIDILRINEQSGDTKINPNIISKYLKNNLPVLYPYVVDVIKNDSDFYYDKNSKYCSLKETWLQEKNIADNVKHRLELNKSSGGCNKEFVEQFRINGNISLTDEQMQILEFMDKGWIAVLSGYPGSGKTQTTKALIRMLEAKGKSYTLLAPTGVSSKVLKNMTGRFACTIHLALAQQHPMGEYVIIDEASMLTVTLLSHLFDYIGKNTKVVFVCDENQLPSIGAGNVVHDLICSGKVPVATLTKIFRYNSSGIITNVTDVRQGKFNHAQEIYEDFHYVEIEKEVEKQLLNEYQYYIDRGLKKDEILILSPFRITNFGSHAINNIIQNKYNLSPQTEAKIKVDGFDICFKVGDRVINTKNNYSAFVWNLEKGIYEYQEDDCGNSQIVTTSIYNGDLGTILQIKKNKENIMQIIVKWDNEVTCIEGKEIQNLLLGYCISGHKSQGAQSKAVIAIVNRKGRENFLNRNLLYTMFSRAQEYLSIVANKEIIEEGLEYQANLVRETWLEELLNE